MIRIEESINNQPKTKAQCLNCRSEYNVMSIKVSTNQQTSYTVIDLCEYCRNDLHTQLEFTI